MDSQIEKKMPLKPKVVLLVGGLGTRLRPITEKIPKPMIDVNGRPFLELKVEVLKKYGLTEFIFCVGHLGHIVEDYFGDGQRFGVNIKYSYEKEGLMGTAGAIKKAEELIGKEDFLVMNGDTYLDLNIKKILDFHRDHGNSFTMVICNASHPATQELVELNEGGDIEKIHQRGTVGHENNLRSNINPLINAGCYIFNKEIFDYLPLLRNISLEQEILPKIIGRTKSFFHTGYMLDIADQEDWKEFIKDLGKGFIMPSILGYKKIIKSRAPMRITFAGGGTDISPYDIEHGGVCVGATINRYVYSTLKIRGDKKITIKSDIINIFGGFETHEASFEDIEALKILGEDKLDIIKAVILEMSPDYGFDIYVRSDVAPHSGFGSSASLCVSVIGVFNYLRKKNMLNKHQIAETAFKIEEQRLFNKGGRQDQYSSAFGGINLFEFRGKDNVRISPLDITKNNIFELEKNLLVVSSGRRVKSSGQIHQEEVEQKLFEDFEKIKKLHDIKDTALEVEFSLRRGNFRKFSNLILESWEKKKKFNPLVSNPYIDALIEEAIQNGAIGARLMGAGGGGHLLICCEPDCEHKIKEVLSERGAKSIDFSFDFEGLQVWEVDE